MKNNSAFKDFHKKQIFFDANFTHCNHYNYRDNPYDIYYHLCNYHYNPHNIYHHLYNYHYNLYSFNYNKKCKISDSNSIDNSRSMS